MARPVRNRRLLVRVALATRRAENALLVTTVLCMVGLGGTQILLRNLFDTGIVWSETLLRVMVLWVGMLGAIVASRRNRHIRIDILSRFLAPSWQIRARFVTHSLTAVICTLLAYHSARLVLMDHEAATIAFANVPVWVCELIMPIGFGIIALRYFVDTALRFRELRGEFG